MSRNLYVWVGGWCRGSPHEECEFHQSGPGAGQDPRCRWLYDGDQCMSHDAVHDSCVNKNRTRKNRHVYIGGYCSGPPYDECTYFKARDGVCRWLHNTVDCHCREALLNAMNVARERLLEAAEAER